MAGTGVGKFSSTASNNTSNLTVNFAENMAPSNVNNAARELMGHMRDMYEQLGDGYFEFGDGDGEYTVTRGDADTITITGTGDITSVYYVGRKIRITDGGANVVEGVISGSSHSSTTQTIDLSGISLASGTPTKVELGIDTAAFGGKVILDDDGDTYIEAPTDDTIDIYVAGAKDFVITANTFTAESGSTIAAQALTATTVTATGDISLDGGNFVFNESSADKNFRVESNGQANMLFVDGGENRVGVGTNAPDTEFHVLGTGTVANFEATDGAAFIAIKDADGTQGFIGCDTGAFVFQTSGSSFSTKLSIGTDGGTTITTAGNNDTLTLISTDADENVGPQLVLHRDSASPANNDVIGRMRFEGEDNEGNKTVYAQFTSQIIDKGDSGGEDSTFQLEVFNNGAIRDIITVVGTTGGTPEVVFNEASQDVDFRVESNGNANMLFVNGGTDRVHFGGSSGDREFNFEGADNLRVLLRSTNNSTGACQLQFGDSDNSQIGRIMYEHDGDKMTFHTSATERMRIHSGGDISIGRTTVDTTNVGISLEAGGTGVFVRSGGPCLIANRLADDGEIIRLVQAGTTEGTISVSGSTISYNAFTGSHWSRLADNSKPSILVGTIMESLDSMINWYQAVANVAEVKYTAEDQAVIDGDKNVGDVKTEAHTIKEEIALPDGKSVGDAVTFTHYGTEYTGVYAKENDVKHVHSKVSDLADSTRVYGVFHCWGNDNVADVNDMEIAQVGTYIIRVHKDVTVSAGDLLVSNGDGTAKKQDDDIIRSKTVAKVNSNVKVETYADGSYTVPCTLHC